MHTLVRSLYRVVLCFLIVVSPHQASAQAPRQAELEAQVFRLSEAAKLEPDPVLRGRLVARISNLVFNYRESGGEEFSPALIESIADLLADEEDGIRGDVAHTLGIIGPPAADATRALETALLLREYEISAEFLEMEKRTDGPVEMMGYAWDSENSICWALHEIGTTRAYVNCLDGYYKLHPHYLAFAQADFLR